MSTSVQLALPPAWRWLRLRSSSMRPSPVACPLSRAIWSAACSPNTSPTRAQAHCHCGEIEACRKPLRHGPLQWHQPFAGAAPAWGAGVQGSTVNWPRRPCGPGGLRQRHHAPARQEERCQLKLAYGHHPGSCDPPALLPFVKLRYRFSANVHLHGGLPWHARYHIRTWSGADP